MFVLRKLDMFHRQSQDEGSVASQQILRMWYAEFHHAYLIAKADGIGHLFEENVRDGLRKHAQQAWEDQIEKQEKEQPPTKGLKFQQSILEVLENLEDINIVQKNRGVENFFVDIFLPQQNLIIEADDSTRFTRNSPYKLMADYLVQDRILKSRGYQVIRIPHFEWNKLNSSEDQSFYIKDRLEKNSK
eukprot:TRINITY_DN18218_c0_g1_i1.p2 TRINITY_DN18218_c0_g1~~TRINITY_DN18218_c0_g1_i1.p2  ORF type:complete len:188 (+),score=18.18 TRINITY_DN18218_c0_g1_i1:268-831(+)